jgi:hypothetical protein
LGKWIANILLWGLAIALTLYTGTRTLHLLSEWTPQGQEYIRYLGLAAFEGGLYFWAFYFVTAAAGSLQRAIAIMMVLICFVAVGLCVLADTFLVAAETGKLPDLPTDQKQFIVGAIVVVIVANVGAFLAAKLTDPKKLREFAVQSAEDVIYDQELQMIRGIAPSVAAQLAPIRTQQWVNATWDKLLPGTNPGGRVIESTIQPAQQPAQVAAPASAPTASLEEKKGLLDRARGFLAGKQDDKKTVTLVQTGQLSLAPAQAATPVPAPRASVVDRRKQRQERMRAAPSAAGDTPAVVAGQDKPQEHRTCSECGRIISHKNAKQLTCGLACRKARSRRLAREKRDEHAG